MSDGAGRGATFILELPHGAAERPLVATASQTISATSILSQSDLRGVSVLVVDDQPDALLVLERILEGAAASVKKVSCAEEALKILSRERFDVIVSDIAMPGMNGYDFVAELLRRGIDTPTIALTAAIFPTDVRKATTAGFRAHISKPIDRASLLAAVSRLANRDPR